MSFSTTRKGDSEGVISTNNSMYLNLTPGQNVQGSYEEVTQYTVASITLVRPDTSEGTVYIDQAVDDKGGYAFNVSQVFNRTTPRLISSLCGSKYMRIRVSAATAVANGYLQVIYHKSKACNDLINVGAQHVIVSAQSTAADGFGANTQVLPTTSLLVGQAALSGAYVNMALNDDGSLAYGNTAQQQMTGNTGVFNTKAQMVGQSAESGAFVNLALDDGGHISYANNVGQSMTSDTGVFNSKAQMVGQSAESGQFVNISLDDNGNLHQGNVVEEVMRGSTRVFNTKSQVVGQSAESGAFVSLALTDKGTLQQANAAGEGFTANSIVQFTKSALVGQAGSSFVDLQLDPRGYTAYPNLVSERMEPTDGVFYTKSQMVGLGGNGHPLPLQLNDDGTFAYSFHYLGEVGDTISSNSGQNVSKAILTAREADGSFSMLRSNNAALYTQQVGNITVDGSIVAYPSSTVPTQVYAANALPVLQANAPWGVCQANVPWITQQLGNVTVQGSSIALPSSQPYLVAAAQVLPVVQTANVPVVQSNLPWITQQLGNVTVQGSTIALPSSSPYGVIAAQTLPVIQMTNVAVVAANAIPVLQSNNPWITQHLGNVTVQGSAIALPSSQPYPVVQTANVAVVAANALPVLQSNAPWSVCQANLPWITQHLGNITVQGSAVALPSSQPYPVVAAQTLPVVQTTNVAIVAANALPVLQSNAPWSVCQANVPWITQHLGNITVQGSAIALPSSQPYPVAAAQTLPVVQTTNVAIVAANAIPVLQSNAPWSVCQANTPWITQQLGNITVQGSAVALPSSQPYPVIQTTNVAIVAANAIPVLQSNTPWSVCQANTPWITQQLGNIIVQGSAIALPSSQPYPVIQTTNVAIVAANAIPVLQSNAPWSVCQANTPWITQQLGNITVQGSAVALPSSQPYPVVAAQTLPVVQTNNVAIVAANALPVLQSNAPWSVCQANVPWVTQQQGNIIVQGSTIALPSSQPYPIVAAQTIPIVQTTNLSVVAANALPVLQSNAPWSVCQANMPWVTQQQGNIIVQGSAVALPSSQPYPIVAAQTIPIVQTTNLAVVAANALPVLQSNAPWSVCQANVPWITQQLGNITVQGSAIALPSSQPYPIIAAQTLPVLQTNNVAIVAANALPVLQSNAPWSVCQANVPWITQQLGNITVQGSAIALPSSQPYPIVAAQTIPIVQTTNLSVVAANALPVLQSNAPWSVCQANLPWITQQLGNIIVQGSAVALPSSQPYSVLAAQTLPVVQTNNVAIVAANALPVLQGNTPWSVCQANLPWITQQLGNIIVQGSAVALPSSQPYPVVAAQTLPVVQTNNVAIVAANALPVLQGNAPWSVCQANLPWVTQQLGNVVVQGSAVALPSSQPYPVIAAQTIPIVQTTNLAVVAANALPVLQSNAPWSVCQANVPWITQQLGNITVQGSAIALPSSQPYPIVAAQTIPIVQTTNIAVVAANALPVLQSNAPWSVCQANLPWVTQQLGNVIVQGSAVALPSSQPYPIVAAQTIPIVQTTNVAVVAANALPVLQSNAPWSVCQANVPWVTQQLGNITMQGSAIALPSSQPYPIVAAQTIPIVQTTNIAVVAANALPVLQSNAPWSVCQANLPWVTQQLGNITVQGSAIALPSSQPYPIVAAQTIPIVQTTNLAVVAANAFPVLQGNAPWSVCQANVPWVTQQLGNITVQGSAIALPSSQPYPIIAAQTIPIVQTTNIAVVAANALPVLQSNAPWSVCQANLPWITQQLGNITVQGSAIALPSSQPYPIIAAQTIPIVQTTNIAVVAANALPVLQSNAPWSVCQANVPWITQQLGNIIVQGSAVALPSSQPYPIVAAQTIPIVQTTNIAVVAANAFPVLQGNAPWAVCQSNNPWITQQLGNITVQGAAVALPSSQPYSVQQSSNPWFVQGIANISTVLTSNTPALITKSLLAGQEVTSNNSLASLTLSNGALLVAPQYAGNIGSGLTFVTPAASQKSVLFAQENNAFNTLSTSNGALVVCNPQQFNATFGSNLSLATPAVATRSMLSGLETVGNAVSLLRAANGIMLATPQYSGVVGQGVASNTPADAVRSILSAPEIGNGVYSQINSSGGNLVTFCAGGPYTVASNIVDASACHLNKTILSGRQAANAYVALAATSQNFLRTTLEEPQDLTGHLQSVNGKACINLNFSYDVNPLFVQSVSIGAALTQSKGSLQIVSSNTAAQVIVCSQQYLVSAPGASVTVSMSGTFNSGNTGLIGYGNYLEGTFFGYSQSQFGVLTRTGGIPEVRTLTINTAPSASTTANVTLDGVYIPITATGTTVQTLANTIYNAVNTTLPPANLLPTLVGTTLTFISLTPGPRLGKFAFACATPTGTGATAATAAYANVQAGVLQTDTFYPQSAWNVDVGDGTKSLTPFTPAIGTTYAIKLSPYGLGPALFYISDQITGRPKLVHVVKPQASPLMYRPNLPVAYIMSGAGNLSAGHALAMLEGDPPFLSLQNARCNFAFATFVAGLTVSLTVPTNIVSLCNLPVFRGTDNRQLVNITQVSVTCSNTNSKPMAIQAVLNGTFSDPGGTGIIYASVNPNSCCSTSITNSTVSGGTLMTSYQLTPAQTMVCAFPPNSLMLQPGDICSFAILANRSAAAATEVDISVTWQESP